MIIIEGKQYYTTLALSKEIGKTKTYLCRLARQGKLRHIRTDLGYLFPVETIEQDWNERLKKT